MGKTCAICGKPSGMYPLCKDCLKLKAEGTIIKCDDCGTWHYADQSCVICRLRKSAEEVKQISDLTCIICGEDSNGKHFCRNCYAKYKDRSVDLRITHCRDTQILDEYGNCQYKCMDGRKVRSRAEWLISDFLFNNKVRTVYEQTIYYKENGEDKTLHPDFYLLDYNVYIEYNELKNKSYLESKEYTQKIYDKLGKKVITMTDKDLEDMAAFLKPKLGLN